ncbi:MAG: hypothetical protein JSR66_10010 [Proteobacteria bacterium]|nr:hypothetical protein [Pseudomonadota bacterium]
MPRAIATLFDVTPRYLRSANLERDYHDPRALEHYVLTPHGRSCLQRLAGGLKPGSTQRAWRMTGNYGTGKSSFAVFLAHWFGGSAARLSKVVDANVSYDRFQLPTRPTYLPLLVTGSRQWIGRAILSALADLLEAQYTRGVKSALQGRLHACLQRETLRDDEVVQLLQEANEKLVRDRKGAGLLLLLDELGKFLEHAAQHPTGNDIYLLQRLAETACRSGSAAPLFVIGLLHQGFDAYAESLDPGAQREWEKIAGRFEELVFNQPLLEVSELIASALRVRTASMPSFARDEARAGWTAAYELGWMGTEHRKPPDASLAVRLYPLHGTAIAPMVKTFARFGQNERSLFSFLLSDEPHGLQQHARAALEVGRMYRLPQLYDYIRSTFGHRLALQSYRSHWPQIESMVESFATSDAVELAVVKTVGVLNLIDHPDLIANDRAIEFALTGVGGFLVSAVRKALENLQKRRRVLFRRGIAGGYCLWPHTSVDLEGAYERATRTLGNLRSVAQHLAAYLPAHSLVARRHYIRTGNLRYFPVRYVRADQLESAASAAAPRAADGQVFVALCETQSEIEAALQFAQAQERKLRPDLLIAVPNEPLSHQSGLIAEVLRWEWVAQNTPELHADRFAREELSRQRESARLRLEQRVQDLVGLRSLSGARALRWFIKGQPIPIADGRQLLEKVSLICDDLYPQAPHVRHELLNRHSLSSAAARARMLLIEGAFKRANQAYFGMDPSKKPPEMSMYMSVLERGQLHVRTEDAYRLQVPVGKNDVLRFAPCFNAIRTLLEGHADQRLKASYVLDMLERPPYGVRQGLGPLMLALFTAMHSQELAFYEDDAFLRQVGADEFLRLTKDPSSFSIQLCRIAGVRAEVFDSILKVLGLRSARSSTEHLVLDVVRPLCLFVAGLPEYARNTQRLSAPTLQVRSTILSSRDPVLLLFSDLPKACAFEPFLQNKDVNAAQARAFATALKASVEELRAAFGQLLERLGTALSAEFGINGDLEEVRTALKLRAEAVSLHAGEPRLKAFCLRLVDTALGGDAWLESLGSLLATQPPAKWRDGDEDIFIRELNSRVQRFRDLEAIVFHQGGGAGRHEAYRLALTRQDGHESHQVIYVDEKRVREVEALTRKIQQLIGSDRSLALAALSRVTWNTLEEERND